MTRSDRRVAMSLREALQFREDSWSRRLAAVSLAAEYPVKPHHAEQMLGLLGRVYRKYTDDRQVLARALRRYPAVHVLSTTNAATEHYGAGGFWPRLAQLLDIENTQSFQAEWGQAFIDNLARLKLPTFANAEADAGTRFVGRILLHCGVPTTCLPDYFRIVTDQRLRYGLDPAEFVARARARAEAGRLFHVDMPVNRFLRFGGEYAVDVTDRVFELLDVVAAGGDGRGILLPKRFHLKALEMRDAGRIERVTPVSGQRSTKLYPSVALDPYGGGPMLHLPPVGDVPDGTAVWVVTLDGDPQRVETAAAWPGATEPAPATAVPIPRPIRVASAALAGREHLVANVTVVDDNDPFLAFDDEGKMMPAGLALPGGLAWLLVPGPSDVLSFDGQARVVTETALPPGWSQWSLTLVDLKHVRSVKFGAGAPHNVRNFGVARIDVGQPVVGVRTSSGAAVFTALPEVALPQVVGADTTWEVSLLDGNGDLQHRHTLIGGDSADDLWGELRRPLLGTFTVRVRGPWGRGAARTMFIAEGLSVTCSPSWRRLMTEGLVPAKVAIDATRGLDADASMVMLTPRQRDCYVTVSAHGHGVTLQVRPPHMSVSYQSSDTTTRPSLSAQQLFTEDVVNDPGTLILDVGAEARPTLSVLSGSECIQTLEPDTGRQGIFRFNFAPLVDTLAVRRHLTVSLGDAGVLPVASIRPRALFADVAVRAGQLAFSQCADLPAMVALVYATRAPWRTPAVLPIENGGCVLPESLVNAGPLLITVRVEDPWAPEPIPEWPDATMPRRSVHADGWVTSDDEEENAVSAFLAGVGDLPEHIENFSRLWTVRATLGSLALADRTNAVRSAVERAMFAQPYAALDSMATANVPTAEIPKLVIRSRLAWANLQHAHEDTPPTWTARGALPCALLSAADEEWSDEEVTAAIEVCGDVVTSLLDGQDPYASSGRFDDGAEIFAADPARRDAMMSMMALVPQGLLGSDTRVLAALNFIPKRTEQRLGWLVHHARSVLNATERVLNAVAGPEVLRVFEARLPPSADGGWQVLPAISMGLACTARYAARGNSIATTQIERQRRVWADFAAFAPQLVTIDLILAELLVAGAESRKKAQPS